MTGVVAPTNLVLTSNDGAAPVPGAPAPALLVVDDNVDDNEENRYTLSQQLNVQDYGN